MTRDHAADMASLERKFKGGQKRALIDALLTCIYSLPEKPIPEWARLEFALAVYAVTAARAKSWDDVFGKPHRGRKIAQVRKQHDFRYEVTARVWKLRWQRPRPKDIFGTVGEEFGISSATCKRYFDSEMKTHSRPLRMLEERFRKPHA